MCMLDIISYLIGKKSSGSSGGSSGGSTDEDTSNKRFNFHEITDDWATIKAHSDNGTAESVYNLGDYKYVEWTYNNYTLLFKFVIVGFNITPDENGVKKGITFMQMGNFPYDNINNASTDGGTSTATNFGNNLPSELANIIGQSNLSYWNSNTYAYEEKTLKIFRADACNLQENFVEKYGTTAVLKFGVFKNNAGGTITDIQYLDEECFPLFVGRPYHEIMMIIGGRFRQSIWIRTGKTLKVSQYVYVTFCQVHFGSDGFILDNQNTEGWSIDPICFRV